MAEICQIYLCMRFRIVGKKHRSRYNSGRFWITIVSIHWKMCFRVEKMCRKPPTFIVSRRLYKTALQTYWYRNRIDFFNVMIKLCLLKSTPLLRNKLFFNKVNEIYIFILNSVNLQLYETFNESLYYTLEVGSPHSAVHASDARYPLLWCFIVLRRCLSSSMNRIVESLAFAVFDSFPRILAVFRKLGSGGGGGGGGGILKISVQPFSALQTFSAQNGACAGQQASPLVPAGSSSTSRREFCTGCCCCCCTVRSPRPSTVTTNARRRTGKQ